MSVEFYRTLHLVGIISLFFSLAGLGFSTSKTKGLAILHGLSLLVVLVAGFGLLGKMHLGFEGWVIAKLIIWLALGGIMALLKRGILKRFNAAAVILGLGTCAIFFAIFKPF